MTDAMVEVLFFGAVSDRMGATRPVELPAEGLSVGTLRSRLAREAGEASLLQPTVRAVVDQVVVDDAAWVRPGQEVAFLSPFSGG